MPRLVTSTSPASRSLAMWCDTVGCERSNAAVKSQMHTGSRASRRTRAIWSRVGSASALRTALVSSTFSGRIRMAGGQQTPRSRAGSTESLAMGVTLAYPLTSVNGLRYCPIDVYLCLGGLSGERDPSRGPRPLRRAGDSAFNQHGMWLWTGLLRDGGRRLRLLR